jgi:hypothetical protein
LLLKENRLQSIYAKYNRNRFPQFQIETSIIQDGLSRYVVKRALSDRAHHHIEAIHQGYEWVKESIIDSRMNQPKIIEKNQHQIVFEFIEGKSLERLLFEAFLDQDKPRYFRCIDRYHDLLFGSFRTVKGFKITPDNHIFLKDVETGFIEQDGVCFPHAFLDLVMDNILVTQDEQYYCIDYEWVITTSFPIDFVFFRSLSTFYGFKYGEFNVERFVPFSDLMNRYGITSYQLDQYAKIEQNFQRYIVGDRLYNRSRYLKKRIFLSELMPCVDGTYQSQIRVYEEKIKLLQYDSEIGHAVAHEGKVQIERLLEQIKAKDDMIALLRDSYSMKIGKTILYPIRYIKTHFFRTS